MPLLRPVVRAQGGGRRRDRPLNDLSPKSATAGIAWPAVPGRRGADLLALQFQFSQSEWLPRAHLLELQLGQLAQVLEHCWKTVPYYRDILGDVGYRPSKRVTWDLLRRLPLLTRERIQDAGARLHSTAVPKSHGRIGSSSTSGSTGTPVTVRSTELSNLFWNAVTLRGHLWQRRDFTKKLCVIRGLKRGNAEYPGRRSATWGPPAAWVFETGPAALLNLMTPIDRQLDWLLQHNPHYLLSQPPVVVELARLSLERKSTLPNLREVQTLGGLVTQETRDLVRAAWGVPLVDMYSTQEVGYVALQSPDREHYLVQAETIIVEVIDEDGDWVRPGEWGRVVLTPLDNFAMPLLRYEVGDYAEVGDACPEGRGLPVLNRILGRDRNMMILPDGRKVFPAVAAGWFDGFPVRQFQVVQKSLDRIEALIVPDGTIDSDTEDRMRRALAEKLDAPFRIVFRFVKAIPRLPSGKFEDFKCEIEDT